MTTPLRFTSSDLDAFPDADGKRYEIIDGELYVSKQPHFNHQLVCTKVLLRLQQWSERSGDGQAVIAPGLIFADDDDVAPDIVWLSSQRPLRYFPVFPVLLPIFSRAYLLNLRNPRNLRLILPG
jgi:Uma2 family endonuclease